MKCFKSATGNSVYPCFLLFTSCFSFTFGRHSIIYSNLSIILGLTREQEQKRKIIIKNSPDTLSVKKKSAKILVGNNKNSAKILVTLTKFSHFLPTKFSSLVTFCVSTGVLISFDKIC